MKVTTWRNYDVPAEKIEQLRTKIYQHVHANVDQFDLADVRNRIPPPHDDILNNNDIVSDTTNTTKSVGTDWMLKRFLISSHKNVDTAFERFVEFFQFRNHYSMHKMRLDNVLSTEIFMVHPFDWEGTDRNGYRTFIIRIKYYRKIPQMEYVIKRGVMYFMEQLDLEYERGQIDGVTIVWDCQGLSMQSFELDLLQFLAKTVPTMYSGMVRLTLIYELPFLFGYLFKIFETWAPNVTDKDGNKIKLFHSVTPKTIENFIERQEIPEFMGGERLINRTAPPGMKTFAQLAATELKNLEEKNINKILEHIEKTIEAKDF